MSSAVLIPLPIPVDASSIAMLMDGILQLGLAVKQMNELMNGEGECCKVDYVLTNEVGDKIGIKKDEKSGQMSFVLPEGEKPSAMQTVDRVRQAYSRLKVLDQMKKQGYKTVKEEKLADGSIRLVVRQW